MNHELLKKAQDCLTINDVFIRQSAAFLAEDYDPIYCNSELEPHLRYRHNVNRSEVLELTNSDHETKKVFRVFIDVGAQWILSEDTTEEESSPSAQIEATLVAEYLITSEIEPDALAEFALHNASFHIWPYWREFLMNQCCRMNLPKITLPTMQLASNRNDNTK
tara:strand:+ start:2095 stop:2586 length:492 start_codon:yes stop_codon:yes gene_type:complete